MSIKQMITKEGFIVSISYEDLAILVKRASEDLFTRLDWLAVASSINAGLKVSVRDTVSARVMKALVGTGKTLLKGFKPLSRAYKNMKTWVVPKEGASRYVAEQVSEILLGVMSLEGLLESEERREALKPFQKEMAKAGLYQTLVLTGKVVYPGEEASGPEYSFVSYEVVDVRMSAVTDVEDHLLGATLCRSKEVEKMDCSVGMDLVVLRDLVEVVLGLEGQIRKGERRSLGDYCQVTRVEGDANPYKIEISCSPMWQAGRLRAVMEADEEMFGDLVSVVKRLAHSPLYREGVSRAEEYIGIV